MAKKGKKASAPKKKASLYKKPPHIPPGEVLQDDKGQKWSLGASIGLGGFGEIYSACKFGGAGDEASYQYVIKIEPIENGPLFVETHFYQRNYNETDIRKFMASRNLSQLGMPTFYGTGSHMFLGTELRFLVLERYGTDISKMFMERGKFPAPTVFQLGLQVLDVLDYIHSRSYIHADIKGANIMLGIEPGMENQAYLLDFGLAWRIVGDNYRPNPKSAHEGTLEYTSRDRHIGAQTMRGDLEILAYNMLQWLAGSLPWEAVKDPVQVHQMKKDLMDHAEDGIKRIVPYDSKYYASDQLIQFFVYINTLNMPDKPDYTICREIFESYLKSVGKSRTSQLDFPLPQHNQETNINDSVSKSNNDEEMITSVKSASKKKIATKQENKNPKKYKTDEKETKVVKAKEKRTKSPNRPPSTESNDDSELVEEKKRIKATENISPSNNDCRRSSRARRAPVRYGASDGACLSTIEKAKIKKKLITSLEDLDTTSGLSDVNDNENKKTKHCNAKLKRLFRQRPESISTSENNSVVESINEQQNKKMSKGKKKKEKAVQEMTEKTQSESILTSENNSVIESFNDHQKKKTFKGKEKKDKAVKTSKDLQPTEIICENGDESDLDKIVSQVIKATTGRNELHDSLKQKILHGKKIQKLDAKSSVNYDDELSDLPEVSFISTKSNNSMRSLPDDEIVVVENAESITSNHKAKKKTSSSRNSAPEILSPRKNSGVDILPSDTQDHEINLNKKSKQQRDLNTSEVCSSVEVIEDSSEKQESPSITEYKKKNKKNKDKATKSPTDTESNNPSDQEVDCFEPKSKKKKKNKSSDACISESVDDDALIKINTDTAYAKESGDKKRKSSKHSELSEDQSVSDTEVENISENTEKKKKKKTKTGIDSESDGQEDSKYRSVPANKSKRVPSTKKEDLKRKSSESDGEEDFVPDNKRKKSNDV